MVLCRSILVKPILYVVIFLAYCFVFAAVTGQSISAVVTGALPKLQTVGTGTSAPVSFSQMG